MINLSSHMAIDAEPDKVWSVMADYSRDPDWRAGVVSMAPNPPGIVTEETTTTEELHLGGQTRHILAEVTSVIPGQAFTWRTTEGAVANGRRAVASAGCGTSTVTLEVHIEPQGLDRLVGPFLRYLLRRNLNKDIKKLKSLVEAEQLHAP